MNIRPRDVKPGNAKDFHRRDRYLPVGHHPEYLL
jgi:hypothetical protein